MLVQCRLQIYTYYIFLKCLLDIYICIPLSCVFVVFCRLLSWKLVTGLQNVSESSIQYANDNADLLASVSNECLDFTLMLRVILYSTGVLVRS